MDITAIKDILKQFKQQLSKTITLDEVVVFGSYARGDARKDSDIDVIVVSNDFANMNDIDRLRLVDKASIAVDAEIIGVGITPEERQKLNPYTIMGQAFIKGISV